MSPSINLSNPSILWLADYNLEEAPGGAQRSDQILIDFGRGLGLNIVKATSRSVEFVGKLDSKQYDILVTSNIQRCLLVAKDWLLDEISTHPNHIRIEHDVSSYLSLEDRIKLFSNCKKSIFLTDFHLRLEKDMYGDIFKNTVVIPDPIDTNKFRDMRQNREDKILYAGYLHKLKGADEFFDYALSNPDKEFVLAGWSSNHLYQFLAQSIKNIKFLGIVEHEFMPQLYNKYKILYYEPDLNLNEPFCRTVGEAVFCGMKIFTNKPNQIGFLHSIKEKGLEQFKKECGNAAKTFWEAIL